MDNYIPLISGLVGALIGAAASVITMLIQSKVHDKREKLKLAIELATQEHRMAYERIKDSGRKIDFPPVVVYLHYHLELLKLMESGDITPKKIIDLSAENNKIIEVLKCLSENDT